MSKRDYNTRQRRRGRMNMNQTGACRTKTCNNRGKRARGAPDIEGFAKRTGVFDKSFYCDDCLAAAAQRSLQPFSTVQKLRRPGTVVGEVRG